MTLPHRRYFKPLRSSCRCCSAGSEKVCYLSFGRLSRFAAHSLSLLSSAGGGAGSGGVRWARDGLLAANAATDAAAAAAAATGADSCASLVLHVYSSHNQALGTGHKQIRDRHTEHWQKEYIWGKAKSLITNELDARP